MTAPSPTPPALIRLRLRLRYFRRHWLTREGLRWRTAEAANRLPRQCWSDLVDWALKRHLDDPDTFWTDLTRKVPSRPQTAFCRKDRDDVGSCYCGKLMTPEMAAEMDRIRRENDQ